MQISSINYNVSDAWFLLNDKIQIARSTTMPEVPTIHRTCRYAPGNDLRSSVGGALNQIPRFAGSILAQKELNVAVLQLRFVQS